MASSDRLWDVWVMVRVPYLGEHEQEIRDNIDDSGGLDVVVRELGREFRIARIEPSATPSGRRRRDALRRDPQNLDKSRAMQRFLDSRPDQELLLERARAYLRPRAMDAVLEDLSDG